MGKRVLYMLLKVSPNLHLLTFPPSLDPTFRTDSVFFVEHDERCRKFTMHESVLMIVMRDEIATTMRLLGVTRLDQLGPHLVCPQFPPRIFHLPLFMSLTPLDLIPSFWMIGER